MKEKIVIFALESISNVGDEMLASCTEYIIRKLTSAPISRFQLMPGMKTIPQKYLINYLLWKPFQKLFYKIGFFKNPKLMNFNYKVLYYWYFKDCIVSADKVVLPVGMLKFKTQDFSYIFDMINKLASKYNKPVFMSAMSIALPDDSDWRYKQVVQAVNYPCVKGITTRDGIDGLNLLRESYLFNNIYSDYVGDPALWIPEVYGFPSIKNKNIYSRKKIGINLIRKNIYLDYSEDKIEPDQLIYMYKSIIDVVIKRGYDWELFCNGMAADYEVGKQIIEEMGLPKEKLMPAPKSGDELVYLISRYDGVFGARLHACITSVSLGIPVSGLLWDKKLHYFSKTMGIRQFFSEGEDLIAERIVDKLERAMEFDFDFKNRDNYKKKTMDSFKLFLEGKM